MGGKDFGIDDTEWEFPTVELGFGDPGYLPLTGKTQVEKRPDGNWYYHNGSVTKPDVARFAEKRLKTFDIVNSRIKEPRIPGPDQSDAENKRLSRFPIPKSSRTVPGGGASDAKLPTRPDQGRDQSPMPGVKTGSGFGPREAPSRAGRVVGSSDHQGVDFPALVGTPVYAPNKAKVLDVTRTPFGGLTIVLGNEKGEIIHKFLHLDKSLVKQDDIVQKGQEIAKSGKSGAWSTGPHLHWEKWVNGNPVNPKDYVNLD
jgi:murein DD-endopeptidase MepM/ murein hydrolase activator NlpD